MHRWMDRMYVPVWRLVWIQQFIGEHSWHEQNMTELTVVKAYADRCKDEERYNWHHLWYQDNYQRITTHGSSVWEKKNQRIYANIRRTRLMKSFQELPLVMNFFEFNGQLSLFGQHRNSCQLGQIGHFVQSVTVDSGYVCMYVFNTYLVSTP